MLPIPLRVFVSSPGDVAVERRLALEVIERMQRRGFARGKVTLEPIDWGDEAAPTPMAVNETPQESVNRYAGRPAECDLTVVILWSRIGTRLPESITRPDGSRYESGTVWEVEDALASEREGREVWLYHCTRGLELSREDIKAGRTAERLAQFEAVERFLARFVNADGSLPGGVNDYDTPDSFARLFEGQLERFVTRRLDAALGQAGGQGAPAADVVQVPWLVREPLRGHRVVGREDLVQALWQQVLAGKNPSLLFLPGVGKTTVAQELVRDRARVLAHFDGVLWANLGRQHVENEEHRRWAEALGIPAERVNSLDKPELWRRALREAIGERRLLVVLDDVWKAEDARRFMALGRRCVYVATTRSKVVAERLGDQALVTELSEAQGLDLLREIAPAAVDFDPAAAQALVGAVQGLPLALVLVGKLLRRAAADDPPDPDRLRYAYAEVAEAGRRLDLRQEDEAEGDGEERSLAEIVELSFGALRSDAAREAAIALSIFRPKPNTFGKDIAAAVCGADAQTLWDISDIGLIEHYGLGEYTMHRVIAEYARTKLPMDESQALHRKALDFYSAELQGAIDREPGAYLGWYRYEQADWQATKDAWLYHLAHSGDTVAGVLAFLRVYFDAFWWWGYYQRFPFCERLIREWRQRELDPRTRDNLTQLALFQEAYPAGYDKRAGGDWAQVEKSLVLIRQKLGLDGETRRIKGEDARRVRAFSDFFLAEAWAYGHARRDEALRRYEAARSLFLDDGSAWEAAWISFYVAQYLLEQAELGAAREHALRSLAEGGAVFGEQAQLAERDSELIANDHRLLGDLALAEQDLDGAARAYCKAALYALAFQAVPEPADSYTMAFYREITGRIAAKLTSLATAGRKRGHRLAQALDAFWAPWRARHGDYAEPGALEAALDACSPERIAAALFPPGLAEAEIVHSAAEYRRRVLAVLPAFTAELGPVAGIVENN